MIGDLKKIVILLALAGCDPRDNGIYTLYRDSTSGPGMRLHVATFDATEGEEYNQGNCNIARDLFQGQPGVQVKYWCERGSFND